VITDGLAQLAMSCRKIAMDEAEIDERRMLADSLRERIVDTERTIEWLGTRLAAIDEEAARFRENIDGCRTSGDNASAEMYENALECNERLAAMIKDSIGCAEERVASLKESLVSAEERSDEAKKNVKSTTKLCKKGLAEVGKKIQAMGTFVPMTIPRVLCAMAKKAATFSFGGGPSDHDAF
jgi:chromosome segregation ATPase